MKRIIMYVSLLMISFSAGYGRTVQPAVTSSGYEPVVTKYERLSDLFKTLDPRLLQSRDELAVAEYLTQLNAEIVSYVLTQYGEDLTGSFALDDPNLFCAGLLIAYAEDYAGVDPATRAPVVDCLLDAFGVSDIVNQINDILDGNGSITVSIQIIKKIGRRYLGWIGLAVAVYEFGDCMNWW